MAQNSEKRIYLGVNYVQTEYGIYRTYYSDLINESRDIFVGNIYIHKITVYRDVKDRFEPLYSITYDDKAFDETKTVEYKSYGQLMKFLNAQRLIRGKIKTWEAIFEDLLLGTYSKEVDGKPFVVKKVVDFENERLPLKRI